MWNVEVDNTELLEVLDRIVEEVDKVDSRVEEEEEYEDTYRSSVWLDIRDRFEEVIFDLRNFIIE